MPIRCLAFLFVACSLVAQPPDPHAGHQMPMAGMDHDMHGNEASKWLMRESSGTVFQPAAWPMPMLMTHTGNWSLMWMGQAFVVNTQQSGPRGGDGFYSANWGMLSAVRSLGKGALMLRAMVSLDPATIQNRRYPLLFQTGETAYGKPIVNGQHPHELIMEVGIQYARPIGENAMWNVYYAPVGEPALGPVAYPHRASAMELPQAAIGHHWQDSTHIANNVITSGISYKKIRLEASGFHGQEPNENRWNIDMGKMDSWSTRFSVFPTKNWSAQASVGRLHNPEMTHAGDVVRTTASVHHIVPRDGGNWWATSLVWGRNYKDAEGYSTHAVLAETVYPIGRRNFIMGRYEWSQRDELFEDNHDLEHELEHRTGGQRAFHVNAFTAGYTRDISFIPNVQTGLGVNVSSYVIDPVLKPYYGAHPWGVNMYLRVRLKAAN